jgi:uncharacterized tellurite resistance protein B-like protein
MSELQLSTQLVQQLLQVLNQHDTSADDPHIAAQYLCAVTGFLLGQQNIDDAQKMQIVDELSAFIRHVVEDVSNQSRQPPAPPPQEAFGIWKPS